MRVLRACTLQYFLALAKFVQLVLVSIYIYVAVLAQAVSVQKAVAVVEGKRFLAL